jgi:hypothetical protein
MAMTVCSSTDGFAGALGGEAHDVMPRSGQTEMAKTATPRSPRQSLLHKRDMGRKLLSVSTRWDPTDKTLRTRTQSTMRYSKVFRADSSAIPNKTTRE